MTPTEGAFFLLAILLALALFLQRKKSEKVEQDLAESKKWASTLKKKADHLQQYEQIDDAKVIADGIIREAEDKLRDAEIDYRIRIENADALASEESKEVRRKAKAVRDKADAALSDAQQIASRIEQEAHAKAEKIAGEAWEAKKKADQYSQTVLAMKNIIDGYGDEYLIPSQSAIDEIASEYDHKEAGQELAKTRVLLKSMIKNGEACDCDYVERHRRATAIEFALDAFNGKLDSIMASVKHDNYGKLLQRLEDAYRIVNHNGQAFRNARVNERYFEVAVRQLKLFVAVQELKFQDREEQKRIKQEMREEERARREFEKAVKQAAKEESLLRKAMAEAEAKLASAAAEERNRFEQQLADLQEKLLQAEESGKRALSMAQQTRQGHVYVISNIGSFGEDVFKIGLTRRLEPLDRVRELGDASVPFAFDVHAMIHAQDAPKLEKDLHRVFLAQQVNKVNPRKEFFRVSLASIREAVREMVGEESIHWTMKSEALEYRESAQLQTAERASQV